jgi:hypothetical protein
VGRFEYWFAASSVAFPGSEGVLDREDLCIFGIGRRRDTGGTDNNINQGLQTSSIDYEEFRISKDASGLLIPSIDEDVREDQILALMCTGTLHRHQKKAPNTASVVTVRAIENR